MLERAVFVHDVTIVQRSAGREARSSRTPGKGITPSRSRSSWASPTSLYSLLHHWARQEICGWWRCWGCAWSLLDRVIRVEAVLARPPGPDARYGGRRVARLHPRQTIKIALQELLAPRKHHNKVSRRCEELLVQVPASCREKACWCRINWRMRSGWSGDGEQQNEAILLKRARFYLVQVLETMPDLVRAM